MSDVTPAEKDFSDQVGTMTPSVDTTQSLSSATPAISQWAHEPSGHGGRDKDYLWTQEHGCLLTKADLATATAESPIGQKQRTTPRPLYGTIPWGDQPVTWWQVGYIRPLPPWKGQCFVLIGINTYSGYEFAPPACNASARTTIHGLTECLIHCHGDPHSIAFDRGTHFTAKGMQSWAHAHRIHRSYHVPHFPEAAGLREQ